MSADGNGVGRRRFLQGFGAATGISTAGCTNMDDGNDYDETPTAVPDPEYNLVTDVSEDADLTDEDYLELEMYVERTLDGETERLDPEDVNIQVQGEVIREHPEYGEDLLRDVGLYREIEDLEYLEDRLWRIQKNDVIAGSNLLSLQVEFEDPEYGEAREYEDIEHELTVQKTREETREDTWIDDPELWKQLRAEFVERDLIDKDWMGIARSVESEVDLDQPTEDMLDDLNYSWYNHAVDKVEGQPSGQAHYLYKTIEHLTDLHAHTFKNRLHDTAGAYNGERAWDVESNGLYVVSPPANGNVHSREPEQTSLMNPEENIDRAKGTVQRMIELDDPVSRRNINGGEDYLQTKREPVLQIIEGIRESTTGRLPDETLKVMRNYGLSAALSPEAGLELTEEDLAV